MKKTICSSCFSDTTNVFKQTAYCTNFKCRYHFSNYITMEEYRKMLKARGFPFGSIPI